VKAKEIYVCSQCGYESPKWYGKCPECNAWNTLEQKVLESSSIPSKKISVSPDGKQSVFYQLNAVDIDDEVRFQTGISELDRVLGGGIVKGSVVLLGGDPGIGKSTLLLQICQYLGKDLRIMYVSGEESVRQIKLRANRLGVNSDNLYLMANTNVERIVNTIMSNHPDVVMVDSIQTMNIDRIQSSPGSIIQVRESTNAFLHLAKSEDIPIIIVGHVNKDGAIAGPKVLEHIVDAVLHFEGDRNQNFRILRAVKNRFGSTNEIGVFEMQDVGLLQVENPSMVLLSGRPKDSSGTCVACVMEGSRPILAEVQALACKTAYGMPRRTATGFDYNRMALILAVLEKRCGYYFSGLDAYLNVVGGLRLDEPAADLPVALALISSVRDKAVPDDLVAFGEIGLTGEVRAVSNVLSRVKEAQRLGFKKCIISRQSLPALSSKQFGELEVIGVSTVKEAVQQAIQ
jgi:DNA repair protein RadA/Sms